MIAESRVAGKLPPREKQEPAQHLFTDPEFPQTPVQNLFHSTESLAITEIAKAIGQSHASVSQVTKALLKSGLVTGISDTEDERRQLISLNEEGRRRCREASPLWQATRMTVEDLLSSSQGDFLGNLVALKDALIEESFERRIAIMHKRINVYMTYQK